MCRQTVIFTLDTPAQDDRPVFITGNFCNWSTGVELTPEGNGRYSAELLPAPEWPDLLEYKYTRGEGGSFELNDAGEEIPNRTVSVATGHTHDYVPFWQWEGAPYRSHWVPASVELPFAYPDKEEPRRVRILLPADYDSQNTRYPVLYLNDGQNAIGEGEGFGSWNAELRMAMLASRSHHQLIIVAVDHAGHDRLNEYIVGEAVTGVGQGDQYIDFLTQTVKPYVDATYRTRADAQHTGIGGSSLGGLISLFGGLMRPDIFGRWLIFSPSLWVSPGIYDLVMQTNVPDYLRAYLYAGEAESASLADDVRQLHQSLGCKMAEDQVFLSVDPAGKHEEWRWSREFAHAIDFLFFDFLDPILVSSLAKASA